MEAAKLENIDIEKSKELFEYEMTEVILKLRGEFAVVSGRDTRYARSAVPKERLNVKVAPVPEVTVEEYGAQLPPVAVAEQKKLPQVEVKQPVLQRLEVPAVNLNALPAVLVAEGCVAKMPCIPDLLGWKPLNGAADGLVGRRIELQSLPIEGKILSQKEKMELSLREGMKQLTQREVVIPSLPQRMTGSFLADVTAGRDGGMEIPEATVLRKLRAIQVDFSGCLAVGMRRNAQNPDERSGALTPEGQMDACPQKMGVSVPVVDGKKFACGKLPAVELQSATVSLPKIATPAAESWKGGMGADADGDAPVQIADMVAVKRAQKLQTWIAEKTAGCLGMSPIGGREIRLPDVDIGGFLQKWGGGRSDVADARRQ